MPVIQTFSNLAPKAKTAFNFLFLTVITLGTYPLMWAARKTPSLHQRALLLRADRIRDPKTHPSSWPWLRAAWIAWGCSIVLAQLIALVGVLIFASVATGPVAHSFRATGHLTPRASGYLYLGTIAILLPEAYILTSFLILVGRTLYPERLVAHIQMRWKEVLDRAVARAAARAVGATKTKGA